MKNVLFIYTRVSTEGQVRKGYSLAAQKEKGIKKAEELNLKYKIFPEEGKSASSENIDDRPMLKKLIDLCDGGKVRQIFVTELDRLSRNELVSATIKKILIDMGKKILLYVLFLRVTVLN